VDGGGEGEFNSSAKGLIGKNEMEIRKLFVEMENIARKFGLQINQEKIVYDSGKEKQFKEK